MRGVFGRLIVVGIYHAVGNTLGNVITIDVNEKRKYMHRQLHIQDWTHSLDLLAMRTPKID